jgi:hypothetical protein
MYRAVFAVSCCFVPGPLFGQTSVEPARERQSAHERLSKLLAPRGLDSRQPDSAPAPFRFAPRPLPLPDAPLPKVEAPRPTLPKPSAKALQPRPASEDVPLVRSFGHSEPPRPLSLPAEALVRLWRPDPDGPWPLPVLGAAERDRASLADPTLEWSVAAAQAKVNVGRGQPVPFEPQNVPNPFEHAEAVRLRHPVPEAPMPPLTLKPPG